MKWFSNLKISTKLMFGFIVVALMYTMSGIYAINQLSPSSNHGAVDVNRTMMTMIGMIIFVIIMSMLIGFFISRSIAIPLKKILYVIQEMDQGHLSERVKIDSNDEIGQISKAMDNFADELQTKVIGVMNSISQGDMSMDIIEKNKKDEISPALKKTVESIKSLVQDVNMLSQASLEGKFEVRANESRHQGDYKKVIEGVNGTLDTVIDKVVWYEAIIDAIPFPIHVTDNDMKWTYMNKSFEKLMIEQGVIRERNSGYGLACSHAGANICNTENCGIKQLLRGKAESFFDWCGMNNKQDTSYLKNKKGENVGYVEVVTDLTPIIKVSDYTKNEVKRLEENLKLLSKGNTNFDFNIKEADKYTVEVNKQFEGINNSLKDVKSAVDGLAADASMLSDAALQGKLNTRADAEKHHGDFKKIVEGVNSTLDSVIGPLNVAATYVDRIGKGDVPSKITDDYSGDFNEIKNSLNNCIDNVTLLLKDVNMLAEEAIEGRFETRAEAVKHHGDFKKVIDGINGTLDTVVDKVVWYEAIIDAIPFPIHVTDNDMNWTYMNRAFEKLMIEQGVVRDRKSGYGLACSHAGATICNTEKCGIKQLLRGNPESFFDWCGMNNKQDTSYLKNKKGENVGYVEVVTDLTPIIRVSNYTKNEVNRLEENLKLLSQGNTSFDLNIEEADKYTAEVNKQFEGINNSLKDVKSAVDELISDASMLSNAALEGKLDTRADAEKHGGDFKKIVDGINHLVEAVVKPIKEVTNVMSEISKGNLDVSVNGDYKGEFLLLAQSVNSTAVDLRHVIEEISGIIEQIAEGNLAIDHVREFKGDYVSISNSLNTILDSLNDVIGEMNTASEQVSTGSSQVSDGSQALSQGATEQASAIEELTSSVTEIASQTKENAINANEANQLSLKVKENAEQGNVAMSEMLKSMAEINESSANISKIIKVIDEIAFQTNILALNAAVEAARAGQHGKGFAVVAEEVRNLAARSANAAKETTALIEGSIDKAEKGTEIANDTAKALYEIVDGVSKVTTLIAEIAASSNEQDTGISQINLGLEQVSQVVQTNSATAEESAAASEELSSQAEILKDMVSKFKLRGVNMNLFRKEVNSHKNRQPQSGQMNLSFKEAAFSSNKPKIALSDKEFGKY
ncbi:chemotaxis protein [Clostridium carboxidivorans P7]|uniref:Methyl-accepting chemotaxis sensory transducer n=1 Tax=Clostridium carboxidivorans P7 TaxID=536227 RepID=C6PPV2_9CLOT|nr:methyl-accepting chemotaxis protein [Clostridium carboxidivorans]AKN31125.1 chemotaxis protein [Clostridium carboxidivorans P7]EET88693.1 methyl-accepting chemotaxis sensory transducer [Clostridium carboxidivorans P7]EFG88602.1 methyl-accepting chemotaxis protein signaling domain protein [Clostridium carboxidivorans P7]